MGTICAAIGWCLDAIARANMRASRKRRSTERSRRRAGRLYFVQGSILFLVYAAPQPEGSMLRGRRDCRPIQRVSLK